MDNKILDTLIAVRDTFGDAVFYNVSTTKNLLADLAPQLHKERIQIAHFLEMGGLFPLKYAQKEYDVVRSRLHAQFVETFLVTPGVADWVLDIFAQLCGYDLEAEKNAYKPPKKPTGKPLVGDKPKKDEVQKVIDATAAFVGIEPATAAPPVPPRTPRVPAQPVAPVLLSRHDLPPSARFSADFHTVAITSDGFVKTAGVNTDGACNTLTYGWRDMAQVSAGLNFTVGLRHDGTLIGTGRNDFGQRSFAHWREVVQISAGVRHTAALRADGTCLAAGHNKNGECNVRHWRNITKVIAGSDCTFGIKKDGRVLVAGQNTGGDLQVSHLSNVTDIAFGAPGRAIALLSDGRIARVGTENHMRRSFTLYKNVKQIAAAPDYFAGLFEDGTVRLLAYFWYDCDIENATDEWRRISAIAAGRYHILGLQGKKLIAAMLHPDKNMNKGQLEVNEWVM